jgi:hypothetical protein
LFSLSSTAFVWWLFLLKVYSIAECSHPRPSTVGYARKFVRSRNAVTVIVTLESHGLDRRLDTGVACAMNGKGRMSPKGPPDRLSLWLRPRDVRSGDAAHRPREMRRSCQLKADGCRGDPDSLYLATDAFCSCDKNENNKTKLDGGASH